MKTILIAEDDENIAELERDYLKLNGYLADIEADGRAACRKALSTEYAALIVDLMLPGINGFELIRSVRGAKEVPIIVVSARTEDIDKIRGLDVGADDYLTKPFDLQELMARLRAIIRRASGGASPTLAHGGVVLDPAAKRVTHKGKAVLLSAREYALLHDMLRHKNEIRSRAQLEDSLYAWGEETGSNTVEVYVHHLRKKFGAAFIQTIRGLGYQLGEEG